MTWSSGSQRVVAPPSALRVLEFVDDFTSSLATSGDHVWHSSTNGAQATVTPNPSAIASAPGYRTLNSGRASNGRAGLSDSEASAGQGAYVAPWLTGGTVSMEWRVQVPILPVLGTDFTVSMAFGIGLFVNSDHFTNGVGVRYNSSDASWIFVSRLAGVDVGTPVDTGVAVVAATWTYVRIEINSVSARVFIGATKASAVLVGTILAASLTYEGPAGRMIKMSNSVASAAARTVYLDYAALRVTFPTSR